MEADRLDAIALITGAGSGLGAAIARDLGRRAEGGLILVDLSEDALAAVADDLERNNLAPERVSMLAFDIADPDRWRQAADFVRGQYGRIDWAVLNAGQPAPTEATDLVEWGRVIPIHLEGAFTALRNVMPMMHGNIRGGGIVVNAPSAAIKTEDASKPGLLQVMRAAAREGAGDNIRVNAIASGGADMPLLSSLPSFQDLVREKGERAALDHIAALSPPLARYAGAEDINKLIIMLLSDDCPMTGGTLVVEGEYTL